MATDDKGNDQFTQDVTSAYEEDPLEGIGTAMKWPLVWLEAIALAWRDPGFMAELIAEPKLTLRKYFLFDLGPYVKLTVRKGTPPPAPPAGRAAVSPRTPLERGFGGWDAAADPLMTEMIMVLPPAPKLEDQAVALSLYNASGRAYPFTCC